MSHFEIHDFQNDDRADVVQLWKLCFPNDPPHNEPNSVIDRKLLMNDGLFFVARIDKNPPQAVGSELPLHEQQEVESNDRSYVPQKVVGTVLAGYDGVRGWIYHLATHPDLRRQGIGRKLMDHAVRALFERGCIKINLQVRKSNPEVMEFYRRVGFTEDSVLSMGRLL